MRKTFSSVLSLAAAVAAGLAPLAAQAVTWHGFESTSWIHGMVAEPESFDGKVVLFFAFNSSSPASIEALKHFAKLSASFEGKAGLQLVVEHRGADREKAAALCAAARLVCPVYENSCFDEAQNPALAPFYYVIEQTGEVMYFGRDARLATEVAVNALSSSTVPGSLLPGLFLKKFKSLQRELVLGRNVEGRLGPLQQAMKRKNSPECAEATEIMETLSRRRASFEKRIDKRLKTRPGAALTDIKTFCATWPSGAAKDAEERKRLEADPMVKKLQAAAAALEKYDLRPAQSAGQARTAISTLKAGRKGLEEVMEASSGPAHAEAKTLAMMYDARISSCEKLASPPPKKGAEPKTPAKRK